MDIPGKRISCCLLALAALSCFAARASAQSLSLTYSLRGTAEAAQQAPVAAGACGGLKWLTSLETCSRDVLARFALAARSPQAVALDSAEVDAAPTAPAALARFTTPASSPAASIDLPTLGVLPGSSTAHVRGARDASGSSTRESEVLLRLGSKHRLQRSEDGDWKAVRFTDVKYEAYKHSSKSIGVELFVPFH